jgi:hypothetical protein
MSSRRRRAPDGSARVAAVDAVTCPAVGTKAERRAARALVAAYHEARLAELIGHVAADLDRYRAGDVDAYTVDETIHHYHRAAQELWKFCWSGGAGVHIEMVAGMRRLADDEETIDWWQSVARRKPDSLYGTQGVPPSAGT